MQIAFSIPDNKKHIRLEKVEPGTIVRFLDSGKYASDLFDVIGAPGENLFVVFTEDKPAKSHVNLVTLDGQHMFSRTDDRLVTVHGSLSRNLFCNGISKPTRLSLVSPGDAVSRTVKGERDMFMVAKGNPSPNEKIPVISVSGKRLFLDEDLRVYVFENASINPVL